MDIDWSAGADGIRQNIYWSEDGLILSIVLNSDGVIMDLTDCNGEVIGTEWATYGDIVDGLKPEE